jgi:hypothetical protein
LTSDSASITIPNMSKGLILSKLAKEEHDNTDKIKNAEKF